MTNVSPNFIIDNSVSHSRQSTPERKRQDGRNPLSPKTPPNKRRRLTPPSDVHTSKDLTTHQSPRPSPSKQGYTTDTETRLGSSKGILVTKADFSDLLDGLPDDAFDVTPSSPLTSSQKSPCKSKSSPIKQLEKQSSIELDLEEDSFGDWLDGIDCFDELDASFHLKIRDLPTSLDIQQNPAQGLTFQKANGQKIEISEAALEKGKAHFADFHKDNDAKTCDLSEEQLPPAPLVFLKASGSKIVFSKETIEKYEKMFTENETESKSFEEKEEDIFQSNTSTNSLNINLPPKSTWNGSQETPTIPRIQKRKQSLGKPKPVETPLHGLSRPQMGSLSTPIQTRHSTPKCVDQTPVPYRLPALSTPLTSIKRFNTRMSGTMSPYKTSKPFQTPFKGGVLPQGLTKMGLKSTPVADQVQKTPQTMISRPVKRKEAELNMVNRLFNLRDVPERIGMKKFGIKPLGEYYESLLEDGVPVDVLEMSLTMAETYEFSTTQGKRGWMEARELLEIEGAKIKLISDKWLINHWALIVWKVACLVRSKPEMCTEWWSFPMVVRQLRYRYEREINNAHRSCVKRVQERDSAVGLPMLLFVAGLHWTESDKPTICRLDLCDGWYKIQAVIDKTLVDACMRGKITVGTKIRFSGATFIGSTAASDVLDAYNSNKISISGNSSSLAAWDSKLGFIYDSPIASFDKLTSNGGLICKLAITITRLFPIGYMNLADPQQPPWSEQEERSKASVWAKDRQIAKEKIMDKVDRESNLELADIIHILEEELTDPSRSGRHFERIDDDPIEIVEEIQGANSLGARQRLAGKLTSQLIEDCLEHIKQTIQQEKQDLYRELIDELEETMAPRQIKSFLQLRATDATSLTSKRSILLTVWEPNKLDPHLFKEGQSYHVCKLIPKGHWKRSECEVTLSTRSDTIWTKIE